MFEKKLKWNEKPLAKPVILTLIPSMVCSANHLVHHCHMCDPKQMSWLAGAVWDVSKYNISF